MVKRVVVSISASGPVAVNETMVAQIKAEAFQRSGYLHDNAAALYR
jgi:hypothetical protein